MIGIDFDIVRSTGEVRSSTWNLKHEFIATNIKKFSTILTRNFSITRLKSLMFRESIAVYSENHMKPTRTLFGQSAEFVKQRV
jgi:hypothetical protein